MSLKDIKLNNFNEARKKTQQSVLSDISSLKARAMDVINLQIYMWENPDDNGADELFPVVNPFFNEAVTELDATNEMYDDVKAVATRAMTPAELKAKYNVDLVEYSEGLN